MSTDPTPARTPYCHKIRYGITGAPTLTEDDMDGTFAPGVGVRPTLIELVYSAAREGKPASVSASVTGDWMRFGKPEEFGGQVDAHFKSGPDGWPAWLAEEARLHDPDAAHADPAPDRPRALHLLEAADFLRDAHFRDGLSVQEIGAALRRMADEADPMVGSLARDGFGLDEIAAMPAAPVSVPPADRAGLRDRIAAALYERERPPRDPHWPNVYACDREVFEAQADAVLSVLPPEGRAAYGKLADQQTQLAVADDLARRRDVAAVRRQLVKELRRLAAEDPHPAGRAAVSATLWAVAEHHTVAEWICCEPIDPTHDLGTQGGAALRLLKALLVDDPDASKPAPLLDQVMGLVTGTDAGDRDEQQAQGEAWDVPDARPGTTDHTLAQRQAGGQPPVDTGDDVCGANPPAGWVGDCWCTLPPGHDGKHCCQPCTDRHDTPGWGDEPAAPVVGQPPADTGEEAQP